MEAPGAGVVIEAERRFADGRFTGLADWAIRQSRSIHRWRSGNATRRGTKLTPAIGPYRSPSLDWHSESNIHALSVSVRPAHRPRFFEEHRMTVRYGVIGCGAIGQRRHIPEITANKNAVLAALCDVNPKRVEEVGAKYRVGATFTDHREMLRSMELDAIVIATPNCLHAPQTLDAFAAGMHVLVENRPDSSAAVDLANLH